MPQFQTVVSAFLKSRILLFAFPQICYDVSFRVSSQIIRLNTDHYFPRVRCRLNVNRSNLNIKQNSESCWYTKIDKPSIDNYNYEIHQHVENNDGQWTLCERNVTEFYLVEVSGLTYLAFDRDTTHFTEIDRSCQNPDNYYECRAHFFASRRGTKEFSRYGYGISGKYALVLFSNARSRLFCIFITLITIDFCIWRGAECPLV